MAGATAASRPTVANAMVVVLTYWLSYEYVRDPRHALEPESAGAALTRGAFHVLSLLLPYLEPAAREPPAWRWPARIGTMPPPAEVTNTRFTRRQPMAKWTAFPYASDDYSYDAAALKKNWARLHAGDAEPLPKDDKVLAAWALFHAGEFQKACEAGLKAGGAGHHGGQQGAGDLRQLPRKEREEQARAVPRSGRARRGPGSGATRRTPTRTTGWPTRWAATARASAWPRR